MTPTRRPEANEAFCRMLGYSREEVAGLNVADWDAKWSAEELRGRFEFLIGKSELFETVHRRKDGTLIDVEISSAGVEIDGRSFLFASSRDITVRKQAEAGDPVQRVQVALHAPSPAAEPAPDAQSIRMTLRMKHGQHLRGPKDSRLTAHS